MSFHWDIEFLIQQKLHFWLSSFAFYLCTLTVTNLALTTYHMFTYLFKSSILKNCFWISHSYLCKKHFYHWITALIHTLYTLIHFGLEVSQVIYVSSFFPTSLLLQINVVALHMTHIIEFICWCLYSILGSSPTSLVFICLFFEYVKHYYGSIHQSYTKKYPQRSVI